MSSRMERQFPDKRLRYCSTVVKTHHDQGNLRKSLLGLSDRESMAILTGSIVAGWQAGRRVPGQRGRGWACSESLKSQSPPQQHTQLLLRGHIIQRPRTQKYEPVGGRDILLNHHKDKATPRFYEKSKEKKRKGP